MSRVRARSTKGETGAMGQASRSNFGPARPGPEGTGVREQEVLWRRGGRLGGQANQAQELTKAEG